MNKIKLLFSSMLVYFIMSANAFAFELPEEMKTSMAKESVATPDLVHLLVSMIFVIAMIYVTGLIYSKLNVINRNKLKQISKTDYDDFHFNVIQSMPLGQQRYIYSIEMGGKILLVGSTPNNISLLKEFDNKIETNEISVPIDNSKTTSTTKLDIDELYKKYKN